MFKVLLETEACEWENSGEGKEMPKKVIQVLTTELIFGATGATGGRVKFMSAV